MAYMRVTMGTIRTPQRTANLTPKIALAVLLALLAPVSMRAGTITVVNFPATGTDAATGITTNQNYVCAFDYGNQSTNTFSVNGVPFAHFDPGNQIVNVTNVIDPKHGGQVILSSGGPVNPGCKLARTSNSGQGSLSTQADGTMFSLLTDLIYVGSAAPVGSWLQQEYDNLTIGHPYSLRVYYRKWSGNRLQNVYFNGEGTWQPYSGNPLDEDVGGAHYLEYDFTASATNVFCVMSNLVANGATMIYAATLVDNTFTVVTLPATNTDLATGITPGKHYVCAFDCGNNATTPSINGVPFTHFDPGQNLGFTSSITDPNFGGTLTLTSGGPGGNNMLGRTSSTGQGSLTSQADGDTFTLLTDLIYVTAAAPIGSWLQQEYDNLTIGDQYSLRIYYRYWGNAVGDRLQNVYFNGQGTWEAYPANPLDEDAGGARYLEYNFKATATNVFCLMTNLVANGSMMVYGATLEDDSFPFAPFITQQPSASTTNGGSLAAFNVTAIGTVPLTYQWYMNTSSNYAGATVLTDGTSVSGSASANLRVTANVLNYYFVLVTNNYGSITSAIAQVNPVPIIVTQPSAAKVGSNVVYGVAAIGFQPLSYQWYFNTVSNDSGATPLIDGNGVSGSTTTNLTNSTNLQDYYFVIVTNNYGSVTSAITAYYPFPAIVTQPAPFRAGNAVGFNVTANGWPTLGYQWYLNTVSNYDGATAITDGSGVSGSTTPSVTIANLLDYYFVVVTNYYGSVTSLVVQVAAPLTVAAAGEPIWNQTIQTNIVVAFSDLLDPSTATNRGNYSLDNGASVISVALVASNEVLLTTSVLTPSTSYSLTVQNVLDYFGILQTPPSINLVVGLYPANLAFWIRADTGVTTNADGTVTGWNDLSGNGNNLLEATAYGFNDPLLTNNASGDAVVHFDSTNGTYGTALYANDAPSLQIAGDMSVVTVVSFPEAAFGGGHGQIVAKTGTANPNVPAPFDYRAASTGLTLFAAMGILRLEVMARSRLRLVFPVASRTSWYSQGRAMLLKTTWTVSSLDRACSAPTAAGFTTWRTARTWHNRCLSADAGTVSSLMRKN